MHADFRRAGTRSSSPRVTRRLATGLRATSRLTTTGYPPGYPPPGYYGHPGYPPPGYGYPPSGYPGAVAQPLKPGIIPLRPLTLSEIYNGAVAYVRMNPKATLGMTAIVVVAAQVLVLLSPNWAAGRPRRAGTVDVQHVRQR